MLCCLFYLPVPAGEMRNDLYITLEKGEFEKGGKSVARNVEITVYVLDIDGQILKVKAPKNSVVASPLQEPYLSLRKYIIFKDYTLYENTKCLI